MEKLWLRRTFIPFTSGQCLPLLLCFPLFPSFDTLVLPATSVPYLDATGQTRGSVTVRLNQLYVHFLYWPTHSFPSPHPASFPEKSVLLCNKSTAYSSLMIIFQDSAGMQADDGMTHCSRLRLFPHCYVTRGFLQWTQNYSLQQRTTLPSFPYGFSSVTNVPYWYRMWTVGEAVKGRGQEAHGDSVPSSQLSHEPKN